MDTSSSESGGHKFLNPIRGPKNICFCPVRSHMKSDLPGFIMMNVCCTLKQANRIVLFSYYFPPSYSCNGGVKVIYIGGYVDKLYLLQLFCSYKPSRLFLASEDVALEINKCIWRKVSFLCNKFFSLLNFTASLL